MVDFLLIKLVLVFIKESLRNGNKYKQMSLKKEKCLVKLWTIITLIIVKK
jgi:hypothetical protein